MATRVPRRFGVLLHRARTTKGLTTRGLADLAGSSNSQVTNWELGRIPHPLNEERIDTLARVLDADRGEFFRAILVEQFVIGLPEPLLKDLRQELARIIARFYSDLPGAGRGLAAGRTTDVQEAGGKTIRILRHGETAGDQAGAEDDSIKNLRRKALIEVLAESGHLDAVLARAALRGEAVIPAEEVEILVGRLFNACQLADLLLILHLQVVVELKTDESGSGRPVLVISEMASS